MSVRTPKGVEPRTSTEGLRLGPYNTPPPIATERVPEGYEESIGPHGVGLIVKGNAMSGWPKRAILDGDTLWVNPDAPERRRCVCIAVVRSRREGRRELVAAYVDARGKLWHYPEPGRPRFREELRVRQLEMIFPVIVTTRPPGPP